MCGIHYIQSKSSQTVHVLERFIENSAHRGPDAKGIHYDRIGDVYFGLGHNLLSVTGNVSQPIIQENYFLSFNGEIYNYKELARIYQCTNYSNDTDVLFFLLVKFGVEILPKLEGMFAFIFVNSKTQKTILARDYFGQKPLFYYQSSDVFVASSEVKNLRNFSESNISPKEIKHFLNFKHVSLSNSIYDKIQSVEAGQYIELAFDGKRKINSFQPKPNTELNLIQSIKKSVLEQSNESSTPSLLYSGGLDSSIILYELKELGKNPIAYTLSSFKKDKFATKDVTYAQKTCEKFNVEQRLIEANKEDFDEFILSIDQPVGDCAFFLQYILTREIAKESKYALTGNGADELFGGYRRYWAFNKYLKNKQVLSRINHLNGLASLLLKEPKKTLVKHTMNSMTSNEKETFINFTKLKFNLNSDTIVSNPFDLADAMHFDIRNFLCQDVLSIADQSAMANGVELRSPFLSQDIYHHSNALSAALKITQGGKFHLKELYHKPLNDVVHRQKEGFGLPFISFWGESKKKELLHATQQLKFFIDQHELSKIEFTIKKWSNAYSNEYWTILILCRWLELNHR